VTREDAAAKGRRYLVEGRLVVEAVDGNHIAASCRGNGALYQLGYVRGGWHCDCPARSRCAHLVALMTVTVAPPLDRLGIR
jgi:hypothetical protein